MTIMDKENLILKLVGEMASAPPISGQYIIVAELRTVDTNGRIKTIDTNTAIISPQLITKIKPSHCNPFIETTGPWRKKHDIYRPDFWLNISPASGLNRAEPLAVVWSTGNHTSMQPDQGFLSALGLTPRLLSDEICWDDLSSPKYDIVKNKPMAFYDFPHYSTSCYMMVDRDYLVDYLNLRQKAVVQVFTITEDILLDMDIEFLLNGKEYYIEEFKTFEIRLKKSPFNKEVIRMEINGYRRLLPQEISDRDKAESTGHYWMGISGLVSEWRARREMSFEYVYVSDEVLEIYESDEAFKVYPRSGSVKYGIHWSVGHCERVGRNAIKLELKKLYEGTPYDVISHWNKFSIDPAGINLQEENIEQKSQRIIQNYFLLSRLMADIFKILTNTNYTATDVIDLDEKQIEYTGWQEFPEYNSVANHVKNVGFSKELFINRCKKLYILLVEHLIEKNLRKVINHLGFLVSETQNLRSLKLLELILKYLYIADESGLDPFNNCQALVERVIELKDYNPIPELMALNAIRQLDAHKSPDAKLKLNTALKTFGIEPNALTNNYAKAIDQVYDRMSERFTQINSLIIKLLKEL